MCCISKSSDYETRNIYPDVCSALIRTDFCPEGFAGLIIRKTMRYHSMKCINLNSMTKSHNLYEVKTILFVCSATIPYALRADGIVLLRTVSGQMDTLIEKSSRGHS